MKRWLLLGCWLLAGVMARAAEASPEAEEIRALLAEQTDAWNRGDLVAFMQGYEKSDTLRFASGGEITHGWQPTLARYQARYPNRAAMGRLTFLLREIAVVAPDAAVVFGGWELDKGRRKKPHGLFTLTLRKGADGWRIVADHTSSAER